MDVELAVLKQTEEFSLVPPNVNHQLIGSKWIFGIKYKCYHSIERYKIYLVSKEFAQQEGLDYH